MQLRSGLTIRVCYANNVIIAAINVMDWLPQTVLSAHNKTF